MFGIKKSAKVLIFVEISGKSLYFTIFALLTSGLTQNGLSRSFSGLQKAEPSTIGVAAAKTCFQKGFLMDFEISFSFDPITHRGSDQR